MSVDADYVPVPVSAGMAIVERYRKSRVVIVSYDSVFERTHTVTYGLTAYDKENAAAAGEVLAAAFGSDMTQTKIYESFLQSHDPALLSEAGEILMRIRNDRGTTPMMLQRVERWCRAAGHGLREA